MYMIRSAGSSISLHIGKKKPALLQDRLFKRVVRLIKTGFYLPVFSTTLEVTVGLLVELTCTI